MRKRLHVFVKGLVQGVNFRSWTKAQAERLNLTGWVRNLPDGRVAVLAEGEQEALEKFLTLLQSGHPWARVEKTERSWAEDQGEFTEFSVNI
jgi:acylphosphatase